MRDKTLKWVLLLALVLIFSLLIPKTSLAKSGCCSWHNGVCGCSGGRQLCCDGTLSPSCTCYSEPVPTITPKQTVMPTLPPTPKPTMTPTITPTATSTPKATVQSTPTITPTATPTETPTQIEKPIPSPTSTPIPKVKSITTSQPSPTPEVQGAKTGSGLIDVAVLGGLGYWIFRRIRAKKLST